RAGIAGRCVGVLVRLIFLSGLSGSGKSVALHMLEDLDFYCIDNIPAALLQTFISHTVRSGAPVYQRTAVGIDARNPDADIATVPMLLDAIALERTLLEPVVNVADLVIDTSRMGVHELRELINRRVGKRPRDRMSVLFESFGFKHGIPGDADFVFDARSLPNPYWESSLRALTGRDQPVVHFLEAQAGFARFIEDVGNFIEARIPEHQAANRRYLTVAVGCTGGQHRSVYIVEQLAARIAARWPQVALRHSALPDAAKAIRALAGVP